MGCRASSTDPLGRVGRPRGSCRERRLGRTAVIFVGDDWAEAHHDVYVCDEAGARLASRRLPEGIEGVASLHELIAGFAPSPARWSSGSRPIGACGSSRWSRPATRCMRSTRGRRRGIGTVTPCRARSPIRVTPRCWPSWSAPTVTTTARSPVTATSVEGVKVLARAHQNLIWERTRHTNRLRCALREYFPAALTRFR